MFIGGMITFKLLFFIFGLLLLVILCIVFLINLKLIINFITHGNLAGPCVWVSDFVSMGGDMVNLKFDENLDCFVEIQQG